VVRPSPRPGDDSPVGSTRGLRESGAACGEAPGPARRSNSAGCEGPLRSCATVRPIASERAQPPSRGYREQDE
jgi:hypothetical protein